MMEVPMPQNLHDYDITLWLGLSPRKIATLLILILYGIFAFLVLPKYVGEDVAMLSTVALGFIMIPLGFKKMYGMPLEKYLLLAFKYRLWYPPLRPVKYRSLLDEAIEARALELEKEYRDFGKRKRKGKR